MTSKKCNYRALPRQELDDRIAAHKLCLSEFLKDEGSVTQSDLSQACNGLRRAVKERTRRMMHDSSRDTLRECFIGDFTDEETDLARGALLQMLLSQPVPWPTVAHVLIGSDAANDTIRIRYDSEAQIVSYQRGPEAEDVPMAEVRRRCEREIPRAKVMEQPAPSVRKTTFTT